MALRIRKDRLVFIAILHGGYCKTVGRRSRSWDSSERSPAVGTHLPLDGRSRVATGSSSQYDGLSGRDNLAGWIGRDRWSCQYRQCRSRCGDMALRIRKDRLVLIAILSGGHNKTIGCRSRTWDGNE